MTRGDAWAFFMSPSAESSSGSLPGWTAASSPFFFASSFAIGLAAGSAFSRSTSALSSVFSFSSF